MNVDIDDIKKLRELTGAGIMDAKTALENTGGDHQKAQKLLMEKGLASAEKRTEREAGDGSIESYIHGDGKIGAIVELRCETDFVARTSDFKRLARDMAMQVAAMQPLYVDKQSIPEDKRDEVENSQILVEQQFIRDAGTTVGDAIKEVMAKVGENIYVNSFHRLSLGNR